jgi:hypothetical protein
MGKSVWVWEKIIRIQEERKRQKEDKLNKWEKKERKKPHRVEPAGVYHCISALKLTLPRCFSPFL